MTDRDDVLSELRAALDVEPSPGFAAGVRAKVVRSRVRTRQMWWGLAAAASVMLATAMLWRPAVIGPAEVAPQEVVAEAQPVNEVPAAVIVENEPVVPKAVVARETTPRSSMPAEPRLEVITNQGAILRALWAGYGTQVMEEIVTERAEPDVLTPMALPPAITVDPIVVAPIVMGELGSTGEGGSAAPVIRRERATKETR